MLSDFSCSSDPTTISKTTNLKLDKFFNKSKQALQLSHVCWFVIVLYVTEKISLVKKLGCENLGFLISELVLGSDEQDWH